MPPDENPYELLAEDELTQEPRRRRSLTIGELITAFLVTVVIAGVTLFVTCFGVLSVAGSFGMVARSDGSPDPVSPILVFVLLLGVPILFTAVAGGFVWTSYVRALKAEPARYKRNRRQAQSSDASGADPTNWPDVEA